MTLVETMTAVMILTVCVYMLSSTVTATLGHSVAQREGAIAADEAMNLFEQMRHVPHERIFALYNADPGDDPEGPGTAPGRHFAVRGLSPWPGDADGLVGEVILPSPGPELSEMVQDPTLGMPRDLNGDAMLDSADHAKDYTLLPVRLRLRWDGQTGKREFEMSTMFAKLERLP